MYSDNGEWVKSTINAIATRTAMLSIMAARSMVVESVVCTENFSSRVRYKIGRALASGAIRWLSVLRNLAQAVIRSYPSVAPRLSTKYGYV
jgi:hypothetical protein